MAVLRRVWFAFTCMRRIHIGFNSAAVIIVIAILMYKFVLRDLALLSQLFSNFEPDSLAHTLTIGILSSIFAVSSVRQFSRINSVG